MSIRFREIMAEGTPSQILRAMQTKRVTLDHEDIVLCLEALLQLVDDLYAQRVTSIKATKRS